MDPKILLEIFGYLGTAVLLLSFLMTDIKWMRAVNIIGCVISAIYALCVNNMPTVVLNASIFAINTVQLARLFINGKNNGKVISENAEAYNEEKKEENI